MTFPHPLPWPELLAAPHQALYKQDARSCVWRVDIPLLPLPVVIKRFDHSPLRQKLACMLGVHPGQREADNARNMIASGLPVVEVLGLHHQPAGAVGCRVHVATPYRGSSFQQIKRRNMLPPQDRMGAMLQAIGAMAAGLLEAGWVFRDFKTANLVIDEDFTPWLIDAGSARLGQPCRSSRGGMRAWRMLRMLDHTMTQDGWDTQARRDVMARPLAVLCPEPVDLAYDRLARIVLK